jgi:photosystem II stability/assembly factor-like uncharacterized protein
MPQMTLVNWNIIKTNIQRVMFKIIYTYIIFTILVANELLSQPLNWQQLHTPMASSITGITQLSNGEFFLGTKTQGVFKSTNNGASWAEWNTGISNLYINDIYSTDDNKLFACSGATIFHFDLLNEEWINLNAPQADYNCISVSSLGHIIAGSNMGIFRSTDEGTTWQAATTNLGKVNSLVSTENNILFAGAGFGVYKSMDYGDTWTQVGLFEYHQVSDIFIDNTGDIYANVFFRGQGIYRSQNQGVSWEQINPGLTDQLTTTVAVDIQGHIYVGTFEGAVFEKASGQSSFQQINLHQSMSQVLEIFVAQDNTLYICSELGGLFKRSVNFEWEQVNSGLPMGHAIPLGFDSDDNFYLGNLYSGFFRSTDTGDFWFPVAPYFGGSHRFTFLADNNQLFLGTTIEFAFWGMLLRSTDQGESWDYFHEGIPLIHPDFPWIQVVMGMDVNSGGDLFTALNTSGIYRRLVTDDRWHFVNADMPDTNAFSVCVNSNDIIFAGFRDGCIYKSFDNGEKWVKSLSGFQDYTVEFLKSAGNYVFTILHNWNYPYQDSSIGLYSYDNGDNWLSLNVSGLGSRVNSIDFYSGDVIIAGTDTNGVFLSSDFGSNWISANSGLSDNNIKGVIIYPDGLLFCGTENEGIFVADLNPTNVDDIKNTSMMFSVFQNYPNPFNSSSIIRFSVPQTSQVIIKVFDILGNEIETLINEKLPVGTFEVEFNAIDLPSGIYFYRLQVFAPGHVGSFVETKKMVLLR